ncbi:MAG TPA: nitrous oxide reductase family maturation protein NosD [Saprospiraceae bacterium]|nr:nitrous oxide reductase family maturation protein NosD [Saprospiraceae bacterium]MCC6688019.1 nitrous oxide reductase family maturation protein NosD [Saprospiraceae bacterium]HMV23074.1 nitrous oxide reductase family maturation protein NosD [Saprospiraceae bacterium]HMW74176.1 nitrous oxide reductase family maturation protein NosD [Saprospiraceae bacterium]HMX86282.1 nitrous oxide reductase family maturation protein NosD [Saprospiraceae bacterium]
MKYFVALTLVAFSVLSHAKTLQVGKNFPYKTIKEALAASENSDTLIINPGLYREGNIVIEKAVSIIGVNLPIIDGEHKYEVISVKSSNVLVKGLKVINSGIATLEDPCGIKVYQSENVTIRENVLIDNFFAIYLMSSINCTVEQNYVSASATEEQAIGNGIHCWKSKDLKIINNFIKGHRDGIYFEFVTHSVIWRNISKRNLRYGLHFMFSNDDSYIGNVFEENGAGVAVMYTKHVKMFNNVFRENWGDAAYGLLLKEISDSQIQNNKFTNNTTGILIEGSSRIQMSQSELKSNGWGIKISASCEDINLTQNNFLSNTFDIATNGSLVLNNFDGNYWDKYEGYDLNRDNVGDVPYHPLSLFSVIVERMPSAMLLFRSFMITLLDKSEKILPSLTPENFIDNKPFMKPLAI